MKVLLRNFLILFILFFSVQTIFAKGDEKKSNHPDTLKVKELNDQSGELTKSNSKKALELAESGLQLAKKINYEFGIGRSAFNMGAAYHAIGEFDKAISIYNHALQAFEKINHKKGVGMCLSAIGSLYTDKGDYNKGLELQLKAIGIYEDINETKLFGNCYQNIGRLYFYQKSYDNALIYFHKAVDQYEKTGNISYKGNALVGVGSVYFSRQEYSKAEEYYLQSMAIKKSLGDKKGVSTVLNNLAIINFYTDRKEKVLEYFLESLAIKEELNDQNGVAITIGNIAELYYQLGQHEKALEFYQKGIELSTKLGSKDELMRDYIGISEVYKTLNDFKTAHEFLKLHVGLKDSVFSKENAKQIAEMQTRFDTEKKEKEIKLLTKENEIQQLLFRTQQTELIKQRLESEKKENEIELLNKDKELQQLVLSQQQNELNQQQLLTQAKDQEMEILTKNQELQALELNKKQMLLYSFSGGIMLLLLLSGVAIKGYKEKQKANELLASQKNKIEEQKNVVEEKQKEILDSIVYAKRIQNAILAKEEDIQSVFPESLLLYKPKDIVAGDFYFFETTSTHAFYAAADCTGHGVPGALVSVVCSNALTRCIKEFRLNEPGKILDKTRELVIETFRKSGQDVKDGMDISLCSFELPININSNVKLSWAGANNPLWYIQQNQLAEIKPNKQSIGQTENPKPFTTHQINLIKGDSIYLFTDGYADQFGGEKGKKFKYSKLKELLVSINANSMEKQKSMLNETFESWKGNLEQVDDVCVMGVRI